MASYRHVAGRWCLKHICNNSSSNNISLKQLCQVVINRHLPSARLSNYQFTSSRWFTTLNVALYTEVSSRQEKLKKSLIPTTHVRLIHSSQTRNKQDYYNVLGVSKNADQKEIKQAYYRLAKKYHPDVNKNDPTAAKKFQEVSEAYEVIGDVEKRKQYDLFGMSGQSGFGGSQRSHGFGSTQSGFENFQSTINPEELFRKIFGDAGFKMSGFGNFQDFEESKFGFAPASEFYMNISFEEAARGVNKDISVNVKDLCPKCGGKKAEPGTKPVRCHFCNGTGVETVSTGPFVMQTTCRKCHGTKVLISHPCTECGGKGQMILRKKLTVPVPAGVEDGQTVRMSVGTQEIFITFKVSKSKQFWRDGADIHSNVHISLSQAVLGGSKKIAGIYEKLSLKIPAGTQSHDYIRLPRKGISRVNSSGFGDHIVHIHISIPKSLTQSQKSLLLAYAENEKGVDGTIDEVVKTTSDKKENTENISGKGSAPKSSPSSNDDDHDHDNGFLGKLKRKIFG
uniref:DnaJ homolog l(2)tid, mitochondrial n=1 Tax=Octopus vulgaris TaxID=6645 RepID=A0A9Y1G9Y6_OCTVU|nr:DnaJ subfamily a member 3-like protein [Octopus vulgaris]